MTMVEFTIPGPARAKGRPRLGKGGRVFTPQKTVDYENLVKLSYRQERGEVYLEGAISAQIIVHHKIPKSMPKYKQKMAEDGTLYPTKKPDLDNVAKAVLDSLNGICYDDDSQITQLFVERVYSDRPSVVVTLEELE